MDKAKVVKRRSASKLIKDYSILLILVAMILILTVLKSNFFTVRNILSMVKQVSLVGILSMGMMLVIINGGVDLSGGAQIAFTSVVCAYFSDPAKFPGILAFVMPLLAGLTCGLINGLLITGPKIPAFIATLGMMGIGRGLALLVSSGQPITCQSQVVNWLGGGRLLRIPVLIYIFVLCALVNWILLSRTRFGKKIYALGGNEQSARVCGISIEKTRVTVYLIMSLYAALAGILITGRVTSGAATNGVEYHLDAIAAAVIGGVSMSGGVGKTFGVVIGVLIMGVLQNGLDIMGVSPYWQQICKGIIIIVAVVADNLKNKKRI